MANFSTKLASTVSAAAIVASAMGASLVSAASEFLPYAEALAAKKVINSQNAESGYRLNDQITRAELAKVAANLGGYTAVKCTGNVYTDVTASLGDLCDAIETLAAAKVISTASNTFRPTANVTRAEMTKMILGALAVAPSTKNAGFSDVNSSLGDLEGFINAAAEQSIVNKATYFRPNATGSRGEVFKIAARAAKLEVKTPDNKPEVKAGNVTVSLVGSAAAQYTPKNASSVKVGTIKVTATGGDVTLNTLTVSRSGLGQVAGLKASLAQNGVVVGNARTFNNTTQEAVVRLNTPVVLKNGSSVEFDVLASLPNDGTSNSQHQFAVNAANGTAMSPVTLGLLNTTSYAVSEVTVSNLKAETVRSGLAGTRIANVDIQAPTGRDVTVHGITISKNTGNDLSQAITNVKVFRNGVDTGAKATVTSDKIVITGLNTKLEAASTAKYELRADTIYVGDEAAYTLYIANTEDVSATENSTGYVTRVQGSGADKALPAPATLKVAGIKVTTALNNNSLKNVAPGTSGVDFLDGKITSSSSFEVRGFELTPTPDNIEDLKKVFSSLTLDVAGSNYDLLTLTMKDGKFKFGHSDAFVMDAGTAANVRVRGTVHKDADQAKKADNTTKIDSVKFSLKLTSLKNLDNGNTFTPSSDISLTGNNVKISASTLEVRSATVSAPSNHKIAANMNGVEIGRFALEAKNADVRVAKITVKNTGTIADLKKLADNDSSFRLVDLSTGQEVETSREFIDAAGKKLREKDAAKTAAGVEFTLSPALTVNKDTIKNLKLTVDTKSLEADAMNQTVIANFSVAEDQLSTDNGTAKINDNKNTVAGLTYTTAISMPTLKVNPVSLIANGPVATVTVKNEDSDNNIQIKSMKIRVQARYTGNNNVNFDNATVCLRNRGATVACTDAAKVIEAANKTEKGVGVNGTAFEFTFSTNIDAGNVISTNSATDFEVYLQDAPLWVAGDHVAVSVESAKYVYGRTSTPATPIDDATYVGLAEATATSTK